MISYLRLVIFLFICSPFAVLADDKVTLQLKWQHQFQFAGYYAAKAKGYYHQAGLDVTIVPADPELDVIEKVINGNADYGVGSNDLLLAHHSGKPVSVLAVIFQHSPYVLLSKQSERIQSIHDVIDKRVMLEKHADELLAYMKKEGVNIEKLQLLPHSFDATSLISNEVDAMSAYVTDETYTLKASQVPYQVFSPRSVGIDFYGDNLFTTTERIKQNPEQVEAFKKASLRGWIYALANPEEIIELIVTEYSQRKTREQLQFEAEKMQALIRPELIEIGYMLPGRWQHIAETYHELGMLPEQVDLGDFLYLPEIKQRELFKLYISIIVLLMIVAISTLIAFRFRKMNQSLNQLLYIKNRHANIGEALDSITHQLKQPLNTLSILVMRMSRLDIHQQDVEQQKSEITQKCNEAIAFMAETMDVFRSQFLTNTEDGSFNPNKVIEETINLMADHFVMCQIEVETHFSSSAFVYGNKTEFANVILSMLLNSKDILLERKIAKPTISIITSQQGRMLTVTIKDNGAGIAIHPINSIFAIGVSNSKEGDAGLGLYISKKIIEDKFAGSISVQNDYHGAIFHIKVPITQK